MKLLLVEDTIDIGLVLTRVLHRGGHDVTWATTLEDGVAAAVSSDYDLVLTDIGLPDGDGRELLSLSGKRLTAVVISAYNRPDDVRKSLDMGYREHMAKPFDLDQFEALIRRYTPAQPVAS